MSLSIHSSGIPLERRRSTALQALTLAGDLPARLFQALSLTSSSTEELCYPENILICIET